MSDHCKNIEDNKT